jgi:hypothetical protein
LTPRPATEDVLLRHLAVLEHQLAGVGATHAELVELLRGRESGHALLDDERGHAARPRVGIGLGVHHQRVGVGTVGDPHLVAVEHVARLAHRQRADVLATDQHRQVLLLLLLIAVAPDLVDAEVRMGTVGEPDRGRCTADLLHGHHVLEVAHAGAAVLVLDGDAEQAHVAELAPQVGRELVVDVDRRGTRRDLVAGESVHRIAKHVGGLAEVEVQRREVTHRVLRLPCRGGRPWLVVMQAPIYLKVSFT